MRINIITAIISFVAIISSTARAEFFDDAGNACVPLNDCECSGACAAVCGDNDCAGAGYFTAACKTCIFSPSPDGCGDEVAACYPPDPPPTSSCSTGLPMCGGAPECSDGTNPLAAPTCAAQGLPGLTCTACCYQIGTLAFDDAGCL